jgi:glutamate-1-semialdehyde 2,1-aminomutase
MTQTPGVDVPTAGAAELRSVTPSARTALEERFRASTPGSRSLWERATRVMPSGVSASIKYFKPYPVYLSDAFGGRVRDVDGNEYIDLVMGGGPHILGYAHPKLTQAVREQTGHLWQHLSPAVEEVAFAERLVAYFPQLERVRLANTGSEAVRSAIRVARAMTGRTMVAKCEGLYHGSDDAVMVSANVPTTAGTRERPVGLAETAGLPDYVLNDTLVIPFNDAAAASELIDEYGSRLAAVLLEPIAFSSGGAIEADRAFVLALREATERAGVVLIYDEVVTSLRLGPGGAAGHFGVTPDLTCLGKAIGGGLPIGAFGGNAELMEGSLGLDAASRGTRIFQSGTFTGNAMSIHAGIAILDAFLAEDIAPRLNELAARIRSGLDELFRDAGIDACTTGGASIFQLHFSAQPPRHRREILAADIAGLQAFLLGMIAEGVLWTPVHPGLTCASHTDADVDAVIAAASRVVELISTQEPQALS